MININKIILVISGLFLIASCSNNKVSSTTGWKYNTPKKNYNCIIIGTEQGQQT